MRDPPGPLAFWLLGALAVVGCFTAWVSQPKPIRADPQPTAICALDEDTVTADGTMEWPEGSYAPCKWFRKQQDV